MNTIEKLINTISERIDTFRQNLINNQKKKLREQLAKRRNAMTAEQVMAMSTAIWDKIEQSRLFQRAETIMVYYPKDNEVDTRILLSRWMGKKRFVLPVVVDKDIELHEYLGEDHLRKGKYGIMEPDSPVFTGKIDLLIVPGLLYDTHFNRVGRGGGYYDRFLVYYHVPKFGVCYDFQLVKKAPTLGYDKRVTRIYTDKRRLG
ncbi:MAG TPA: 5-formyltetrahydrofolate cyclo-ligase [Bacteroidales bacterium]|jgi:5-formyltetrahydrofolate cyclo-ligase|nr:5-formyltetrahydrofolate cyclo-ligase [Bacteroidales bacterium]